MNRSTVIAVAVVGCVLLAVPATAHADDGSYIRLLNDNGITVGVNSPAIQLQAGRQICDNLRFGDDPRAGMNYLDRGLVSDALVAAAQRELCPGTLHP